MLPKKIQRISDVKWVQGCVDEHTPQDFVQSFYESFESESKYMYSSSPA